MSDEYRQRPPRLQDTEKPGEREEMERGRKEREQFEKRSRGDAAAAAASASEYDSASEYKGKILEAAMAAKDYVTDNVSVSDKFKELVNMDLGELAEDAKEYVRTKPWKAMLLSAGAGFLLGLLIRGRR